MKTLLINCSPNELLFVDGIVCIIINCYTVIINKKFINNGTFSDKFIGSNKTNTIKNDIIIAGFNTLC